MGFDMRVNEFMQEIRWHGRGGQGTKTAALLLAETVIEEGKYAQGFPEYGPERMGAPVRAYNRIDNKPIRLYCQIKKPGIVVVLDETLLDVVDPADGLREEGTVLINTKKDAKEIRRIFNLGPAQKVYTVNATQIAIETIGRNIPNTVMMGALIKITGIISLEGFEKNFRKKFERKYAGHIIEANLRAIKRAYAEVRAEDENE